MEYLAGHQYGRVFTRTGPTEPYKLLEGSRFSKLDFQIYTDDDSPKIHPDFGKFVGKRFKIGVQPKMPKSLSQGQDAGFQARIQIPGGLGDYLQAPLDIENLDWALDQELDICRATGMFPEDKVEQLVQTTQSSLFFIMCTSGRSIQKQTFLMKMCPILIFDDAVEELVAMMTDPEDSAKTNGTAKGASQTGIGLPYKLISKVSTKVIRPLLASNGGSWNQSVEVAKALHNTWRELEIPNANMIDCLSYGKNALSYLTQIRDEALATSKVHGRNCDAYLTSLAMNFESCGIEFCDEWRARDKMSMVSLVLRVRQLLAGGKQICEAVAVQHGLQPSARVKENLFFQILNEAVGTIVQKYNDLLSFSKEFEPDQSQIGVCLNEITILHQGHKWPLEKALEKVAADLNEAMGQFETVGEILLELFPDGDEEEVGEEHEELKQYLQMVKEVVLALIKWTAIAPRYKQMVPFDCYIEDY